MTKRKIDKNLFVLIGLFAMLIGMIWVFVMIFIDINEQKKLPPLREDITCEQPFLSSKITCQINNADDEIKELVEGYG